MMLQIHAILFRLVFWQEVLPFSISMIISTMLIFSVCDARSNRCGLGSFIGVVVVIVVVFYAAGRLRHVRLGHIAVDVPRTG